MEEDLHKEIKKKHESYLRCKQRVEIFAPRLHEVGEFNKAVTKLKRLRRPTLKTVDSSALKELYWIISERCKREMPCENIRTRSEVVLEGLIRSQTKKEVFDTIWIGNSTFDLFFAGVRGNLAEPNRPGKTFNGLLIEVNGPVHRKPLKMKKDQFKNSLAEDLQIRLIEIENLDLSSPTVKWLIQAIKCSKPLDFRAKQRMWFKIHLYTALHHATDSELCSVLNFQLSELEQLKGLINEEVA